MDDNETLVIRCGRCGRRVRLALKRLMGLKTFDCHRCLQFSRTINQSAVAVNNDEASEVLAQIVEGLTDAELSILIRKVARFSDREVRDIHGISAAQLEDLMKSFADRMRSIYRPQKS